jgi:hypothetical protein
MRTVGTVGPINEKTYPAESILTGGYAVGRGVKDGNCTAVTAAGQRCVGIVSTDVAQAGYAAPVVRMGDTLAVAGGPIAYLDYLKTDAVGRLVTIAGTAGEEIVARAESSATALGDSLVVFVMPSVW